ncbi:uncharacterized protein LOC129594401 [Paramacrobiotus metropolitanus]|uniref:uncharacterized protein LOC129594401 n=1 Tax=Paramacrobiotus metropolitanus TaxID=2943436 RepID=UPI002445B4A2|nr:uncharacterized protein LOC129594401 [Paramacrobiotus metropolitanus]
MTGKLPLDNGWPKGCQRNLALLCFIVSLICLSCELPAYGDGDLTALQNIASEIKGTWGVAAAALIPPASVRMNDPDGFMGSNDDGKPSSSGSSGGGTAQTLNPQLIPFLAPMFNPPLPSYDTGVDSDSVEFGGD